MISVFVLSFFVIAQPYYESPAESFEGLYTADNENFFILDSNGEYAFYKDGKRIYDTSEENILNQTIDSFPVYDKSN